MKKILKICVALILFITLGYVILGYLSSYVGWYGYKKWRYRVGTSDIETSKKRGVFVKELHFQVDSFSGSLEGLEVYIEKGFHYGHNSEDETVLLTNSKYPYQLSFGYHRSKNFGVLIQKECLLRFDSADMTQVFLKSPYLKDTVIADIVGENVHSGIIKVWE